MEKRKTVLVLGADGYLGWPTCMHFALRGWQVIPVDSYWKRKHMHASLWPTQSLFQRVQEWNKLALGAPIEAPYIEGIHENYWFLASLVERCQPEVVIHYAEQPSAPYSMIGQEESFYTFYNNLLSTHNLCWAVHTAYPSTHIIKLGTMGEYGTPNIDIEEGYLEVEHKGRKHTFLHPRIPGSLYHVTKVQDTDLLNFCCRIWDMRVTDLMQGPVYGLGTPLCSIKTGDGESPLRTHFNYDEVFGTVLNRFLVQAVVGHPLTVYGDGGQTRGYINIRDTMRCVVAAAEHPPKAGEHRIFNQFTETFSINQLAEAVREAAAEHGLKTTIRHFTNPRREAEKHYYNPAHSGLSSLGVRFHPLNKLFLVEAVGKVKRWKENINKELIRMNVGWTGKEVF